MLIACFAASSAAMWRGIGVAQEVRRDREAAAAYQRGIALQQERRYDDAAAAFQEAVVDSPGATDAYVALGDVEFRRGRTDEAVRAYRQVMARYPFAYSAELHRQVGLIELRGGRLETAVVDLNQAVALDPKDWLAYHLLGHAYYRLGDLRSARGAWEQVVSLNPEFRPAREQLRRLDAQHP